MTEYSSKGKSDKAVRGSKGKNKGGKRGKGGKDKNHRKNAQSKKVFSNNKNQAKSR